MGGGEEWCAAVSGLAGQRIGRGGGGGADDGDIICGAVFCR